MIVNISAKHLEMTPAIEQYIRGKVSRLERHFDKVLQITFVIEKEPHHGFHVELITDVEHHEDFIANSKHDDLYACIDLVLDRGVRQLTDHKDRLRNRKHKGADQTQ